VLASANGEPAITAVVHITCVSRRARDTKQEQFDMLYDVLYLQCLTALQCMYYDLTGRTGVRLCVCTKCLLFVRIITVVRFTQ
jgi:hypothetical protein